MVAEGPITLPSLAPGASAEIDLQLPPFTVPEGAEPRLGLSFVLKADQLWADAGHEVAWADFGLPDAPPAGRPKSLHRRARAYGSA